MVLERPCLYTQTKHDVLYTKFEMKPFQTYLKLFHVKETLQNSMLSATRCSIQAKQMFSKQRLKWNHEKVVSFQRNTRKPMLFFKLL